METGPHWCGSLHPHWGSSSEQASAGELGTCGDFSLVFCPQICPSYQKSCVLASSPWGRGKRVSFVLLGRKKLFNYFSVYCYLIVVDTCNIIALYFKPLVFYILLNYVFKCDKIILAFEMVWPCLGEDPLFLLSNGSSIRYINWLHSD